MFVLKSTLHDNRRKDKQCCPATLEQARLLNTATSDEAALSFRSHI
jgi:hypothetical protein